MDDYNHNTMNCEGAKIDLSKIIKSMTEPREEHDPNYIFLEAFGWVHVEWFKERLKEKS